MVHHTAVLESVRADPESHALDICSVLTVVGENHINLGQMELAVERLEESVSIAEVRTFAVLHCASSSSAAATR